MSFLSGTAYAAGTASECDMIMPAASQFGRIDICASSVLPHQGKNRYTPGMALDDNPATAWIENAPGSGVGEWIEFVFDGTMRFQTIEIVVGYAKSKKSFLNNARPSRVMVLADNIPVMTVSLKDTASPQTIRLPKPVNAQCLRFQIMNTIRGARWQDMAISELRVDLEEHNYYDLGTNPAYPVYTPGHNM
jgi:hypothetical protein